MSTKISGNANLILELQTDLMWYAKPIGEIFYLRDDLPGCSVPPIDKAGFRYIKLTASDSYNSGCLTSESVTGSSPLVIATAVISLVGSPLNGRTVNLLNTERRMIRAGSAGTVENDALQNITGYLGGVYGRYGDFYSGAFSGSQNSFEGVAASTESMKEINFDASRVARTSTETRSKNQGATVYMRIL